MDDYRIEQRKRKRGLHCAFSYIDDNGVGRGCLCGCGWRGSPSKKHKTRIVKRALKKQLMKFIEDCRYGY